jgi:hypothetical protein
VFRCAEWAAKLGVKIVDITGAQETIRMPLPLFFDPKSLQPSKPAASAPTTFKRQGSKKNAKKDK